MEILMPSARNENPTGIGGVVRDGEAGHVDIADGELGAGLKQFEFRRVLAPGDRRSGQPRDVHRDVELAGDGRHRPADVIGVLMGDQDRGERFGVDAGGLEAFEGFLAAESGVDQETGPLGRHQCGVPSTRRRKYPTLYDERSPP